MWIRENISLREFNTFGLNYSARKFIRPENEEEAATVLQKHQYERPLLILGGGSNLLFTGDFAGTIIQPMIRGMQIESTGNEEIIVSAGAGVEWDKFVSWTVNNEMYGLENLSWIPGTVGASPVQNIGAYGAEISERIVLVRAISVRDGSAAAFSREECEFAYRKSIFKEREKGNYIVTRVLFRLSVKPYFNLEYGALKEEAAKLGDLTLQNVRQAVINIRKSKLPDPAVTGNAGSFFKNPVITESAAMQLKKQNPGMPLYAEKPGFCKIAAGWLIESCGWKGFRKRDAGVHPKQALVIVNYGEADGREILSLSEQVRESVRKRFGIELEREVEVV